MGNKVIWQSTITSDMVADFTQDEIDLMIADLNDAVMMTYQDYEMAD
jgi:hypothetical protein